MSYIPLEKMIDKADYSLYKLVVLASKRAIEIAEGASFSMATDSQIKPTTMALQEIAEGKIRSKE